MNPYTFLCTRRPINYDAMFLPAMAMSVLVKQKRKLTDHTAVLNEFTDIVCKHFNINKAPLFTRDRHRPIVNARQIIMWCVRWYNSSITQTTIGDYFGGLDHTTIFHSVTTVNNLMEADTEYKNNIHNILSRFNEANA